MLTGMRLAASLIESIPEGSKCNRASVDRFNQDKVKIDLYEQLDQVFKLAKSSNL